MKTLSWRTRDTIFYEALVLLELILNIDDMV
jgi:hypothetical protein